jgi:hypothetical protein
MSRLRSWSEDENTKYFSGQAVYEKVISVPESFLKSDRAVFLDFGAGTPVAPAQNSRTPGMRALLESPVHEAAVISLNGQAAGAVWRPPYDLDVTKLLHTGANQIRVTVANLAINELAGQSLPNYKLLNLRYGERFTPQDMNHLEPLPSGLLGPIHLKSVER